MTRHREIGWGSALLLIMAVMGGALAALPESTGIDQWWHGRIGEMRGPLLVAFSVIMDDLGGGVIGVVVVPLVIGGLLLLVRGWRTAVFALVTFAVSALLVQAIKHLLSRARPEDLMVVADHGSYPSGHTANAATIAVVLWLVFPRWSVALVGGAWVVLMAFSRTVVSAHWITDTLGGAMLGVAAALLAAWVVSTVREKSLERAERGS